MSLEVSSTTPANQEPVKLYETIHYPYVDIVINNDSDYASYGTQLAELFQDGVPLDWVNHQPRGINSLLKGEVDGRTFIMKEKRYGGKKRVESILLSKQFGKYANPEDARAAYAMTSVLNEITLSPRVKRALAEPQAQDMAQDAGYSSISLIEPVIAISQHSGQKALVYPFIADAKPLSEIVKELPRGDEREGFIDRNFRLIRQLESYLREHGIAANDLNRRNLMRDTNNNLYVMDIEGYVPVLNGADQ